VLQYISPMTSAKLCRHEVNKKAARHEPLSCLIIT
jgi:hypothetical protein